MNHLVLAFYMYSNFLFIATDDKELVFKSEDKYLGDIFVSRINSFLCDNNRSMSDVSTLVFQDRHISYTTERLIGTYAKAMAMYSGITKKKLQMCSMSSLVPLVYCSKNTEGSVQISNMKGGAFVAAFDNRSIISIVEEPKYNANDEWLGINQARTMISIINDNDFITKNSSYINITST